MVKTFSSQKGKIKTCFLFKKKFSNLKPTVEHTKCFQFQFSQNIHNCTTINNI